LKKDIPDVISCFKFGDDRFRGLASAEGQILPFPIDLPCERVSITSSPATVISGAPQGTALGPLLFFDCVLSTRPDYMRMTVFSSGGQTQLKTVLFFNRTLTISRIGRESGWCPL